MFRQSVFFFFLAVTLSEKNKSKSHSLQWVALCSTRVFEWQHKDSLSFLNYFCPHLFYCHPTKTDCETGALQDTSNTMTTLKQFNYSYFSLRSLASPDRSEGKYIRWVELMSLLITTVNVVRLPWFKESLQITKLPGNSPRIWEEVQWDTDIHRTLINENDHITLQLHCFKVVYFWPLHHIAGFELQLRLSVPVRLPSY